MTADSSSTDDSPGDESDPPDDDHDGEQFGSPIDAVDDPIAFLLNADVELVGRMPWSSNATFVVALHSRDAPTVHHAIYKPVRGERPLWDFEPGLDRRERAAYVLSERLGFGCVPPTVIRDGPYGEGSFQWFVDADLSQHYFTIFEARPELHDQMRRIAVLDIIANNTDRKSGHCLLAGDRVWAIDNGLCFSVEDKLRTVIWEFAGDPVDDDVLDTVASLLLPDTGQPDTLRDLLGELLDDEEIDAVAQRAGALVMRRRFPSDPTGRRYPWPLV